MGSLSHLTNRAYWTDARLFHPTLVLLLSHPDPPASSSEPLDLASTISTTISAFPFPESCLVHRIVTASRVSFSSIDRHLRFASCPSSFQPCFATSRRRPSLLHLFKSDTTSSTLGPSDFIAGSSWIRSSNSLVECCASEQRSTRFRPQHLDSEPSSRRRLVLSFSIGARHHLVQRAQNKLSRDWLYTCPFSATTQALQSRNPGPPPARSLAAYKPMPPAVGLGSLAPSSSSLRRVPPSSRRANP